MRRTGNRLLVSVFDVEGTEGNGDRMWSIECGLICGVIVNESCALSGWTSTTSLLSVHIIQVIDMHTLSIIWFISSSPFCSSFLFVSSDNFGQECPVPIWNPTQRFCVQNQWTEAECIFK